MYFLKDSNLRSLKSYPSIYTEPQLGSKIRQIKCNIVVFPNPDGPTIALVVPGFILILKSLNNSASLLSSPQSCSRLCAKLTPLNSILPCPYLKSLALGDSQTFESRSNISSKSSISIEDQLTSLKNCPMLKRGPDNCQNKADIITKSPGVIVPEQT